MGKDRVFGKFTSSNLENYKATIEAASDVTFNIIDSGTDTTSNIYFNLERPAEKVTVRVSAACTLTEFNGKTLKSPLTLNAGANVIEVRTSSFKIVTTAQSVVEVTVK
jgi:hypothetical protein